MTVSFEMEGFKEIEQALLALPAGTAKGVSRRAMKKELKPVADLANAYWPGSSNDVFQVTSRISRTQLGDSAVEFRRNVVNMFVGSVRTPEAHLLEFGTAPRRQKTTGRYTGQVSPLPMLQPAWDRYKRPVLNGLGARLWDEIRKTQERRATRAARASQR